MTKVSMPFERDQPAPLPPLPKPDPVREGARAYRKQLAEEYKSELADLRAYAIEEWQKYRADHPFAENRDEYIDQIVQSLAPEPPPRLSDHEAFRLSIPFDDRLRLLGEHRVFDEFAKVFTVRAGGQVAVTELRKALSPYGAVTDTILDAARLTVRNGQVLFITGLVELDRRADLPTLPIGLERQYRDQLVTETDQFNSEDY